MKKIILPLFLMIITLFAKDVDIKIFKDINMLNSRNFKLQKAVDRGEYWQIKAIAINRSNSFPINIFVTKDKKTVIFGKAFDAKNAKEIKIPVNIAKYKKYAAWTYGSGKKEYFVFTDPECPFCKKFEKEWKYLKDKVKFYIYLYPLNFHQNAKKMSLYILSLPINKRAEALFNISLKNSLEYNKLDKKTLDKSSKILKKQMQIALELGVRRTPSVFNSKVENVNWTNIAKDLKVKVPVDVAALKYLIKHNAYIKFGKSGSPLYVFTDLDCPFCQEQFKKGELTKMAKTHQIYIFLYPLRAFHPHSLSKTVFLLSHKNQAKRRELFERFMNKSNLTKEEKKIANKIIKDKSSKTLEKVTMVTFIANRLGVRGTPTVFDSKGNEIR